MWITDWTARASCRNADPDALFVQGAAQNRAKLICRGCSVRTECLADALDNRIEFGVWGGLTETEREALLRRRPDVTLWTELLEAAKEKHGHAAIESELAAEPDRQDVLQNTLLEVADSSADAEGPPVEIKLTWSGKQLLLLAARILPGPHRDRYAEELAAELWDLASEGAGRTRQILYAIRQFTRVPRLRIELQASRSRKASS